MLNIFKSNRMENLLQELLRVLGDMPENPMEPEWISVQSRGMKQWISLEMAGAKGICSNVNFIFARQAVDLILNCFERQKDNTGQNNVPDTDCLFWSVMKNIGRLKDDKNFADIGKYLKDDPSGLKLFQVSYKIAGLFDDYQIYRPFMIMDWQNGQLTRKEQAGSSGYEFRKWQAYLWNRCMDDNPVMHTAFRLCRFLEEFDSENIDSSLLPGRVCFFGISSMPKIFLQVLEKISHLSDINLFLLTPSDQFFFDIRSEKMLDRIHLMQFSNEYGGPYKAVLREDLLEDLHYQTGNPLLSSLGQQAADFHFALESFDYHEPAGGRDMFLDPAGEIEKSGSIPSMLHTLQSDILNLVNRGNGNEYRPPVIDGSDRSITIHACHSPMREIQVLKDILHKEFEENHDLFPHDVVVMMPDIETYAPFIESVFNLENRLPYAISDRKKRSESESVEAFLKILSMKNSRLERNQVLDLLLYEPVAEKFNITLKEMSMIEIMVQGSGILWGKDGDHREKMGLPGYDENTWIFGLKRLFMGMAMPESQDRPVCNVMPSVRFEGLELEVLGRFVQFVDVLFSILESLEGQKEIVVWCDILKNCCRALIARNYKNDEDIDFIIKTIEKIEKSSSEAGFEDKIIFNPVYAVLEKKLEQNISQGNFLSGSITFCNIMPMRSIPFKIVVMMGMDENSFPRKLTNPGFDLMKLFPEPCDKNERDEDRFLFLEALLCARSKLIITYTGQNIQDNSIMPCSGPVSELMDVMDKSFAFETGYAYHFFHPLHPFSSEYFEPQSSFPSFSKDNLKIARSVFLSREKKENRFIRAGYEGGGKKDAEPPGRPEAVQEISMNDLIRFFKHPLKWYMTQILEIKIPEPAETAAVREPFSLKGLEHYSAGRFMIEKNQNYPDPDSENYIYQVLNGSGSLPYGKKGRQEYEKIKLEADPIVEFIRQTADRKSLPSLNAGIDLDDARVHVNLSDIRDDGLYAVNFGKLNGSRMIEAWIRHLCLNAAGPDHYPKNSLLVTRDAADKNRAGVIRMPDVKEKCTAYLGSLVNIFLNGRKAPFYFACETSRAAVEFIMKNSLDLNSENLLKVFANYKVKDNWYGSRVMNGEFFDPYISLCLKNNDLLSDPENPDALQFAGNSLSVYEPILSNTVSLK